MSDTTGKSVGKIRISMDFECGWGSVEDGNWRSREAAGVYDTLRPAMRRYLDALDRFQVPCTWACVGAMIDDPKARDLSYLKGSYDRKTREFLAEAKPNTIDGRDLLAMIQATTCAQSFGTHSYSHMNFQDPEQDDAVARAEMENAARANGLRGIAHDRLVFPRNLFGHFDAVMAAGTTVARMPAHNATSGGGLLARAWASYARPPSPVLEQVDASSGLTLHYGSEFLNWGARAGGGKQALTKRRHTRALEAAARGADIHFWLHPCDLAETPGLDKHVETVLARIAILRDKGLVETVPF